MNLMDMMVNDVVEGFQIGQTLKFVVIEKIMVEGSQSGKIDEFLKIQ
jgi:hypothetical protein